MTSQTATFGPMLICGSVAAGGRMRVSDLVPNL